MSDRICIPVPSTTVIGISTNQSGGTEPSLKNVRNEPTITGLTGGESTKLDGCVTADNTYPVGITLFIVVDGVPSIYQLVEGTNAEASPSIIRPDDYAAQTGTNRVWVQRM